MIIQEMPEELTSKKGNSMLMKTVISMGTFWIFLFAFLQFALDVVILVFLFSGNGKSQVTQCLKTGDFIVNGQNYVAGMSFSDLGSGNASISLILQNGTSEVNVLLPPILKAKYVSDGVYRLGIGNNDPQETLDVSGNVASDLIKSDIIQPKSSNNLTIKGNVLNFDVSAGSPNYIETNLPLGIPWNILGLLKLNSGTSIDIFDSGSFVTTFTYGLASPHNVTFNYLKVNKFVILNSDDYFAFPDYNGLAVIDNRDYPIDISLRPAIYSEFINPVYIGSESLIGRSGVGTNGVISFSPNFYISIDVWPVGPAALKMPAVSYNTL